MQNRIFGRESLKKATVLLPLETRRFKQKINKADMPRRDVGSKVSVSYQNGYLNKQMRREYLTSNVETDLVFSKTHRFYNYLIDKKGTDFFSNSIVTNILNVI